MPFIHVRAMEGAWSPKQRRELVRRITEAVVDIQGEGLRQSTLVLWDDIKSGHFAIGGAERTTALVRKAARSGRSSK